MASKRNHSSCTLKQKLEVLRRIDEGEKVAKLSLEYGVGRATISDWKRNRLKIEQFCSASTAKTLEKRQKTTVSSYGKLDEALYLWFTEERQKGISISGPMVKEKALQLNKLMDGDPSFSASSGFLDRWKKRHGIRQNAIAGEKLSADSEPASNYLKEFKDLVSSQPCLPQQVNNADEIRVNFNALPTWLEKSAPELKTDKQRPTALACNNASATNKLPLMVIGKSDNWPVYYKNEKKSLDGHQEYRDEDMVQGSSAQIDSEESEEEVNTQTELISHTDAANALDLALRYVEQHSLSTLKDVMFMQRWRNIASSSALCQKKKTDLTP